MNALHQKRGTRASWGTKEQPGETFAVTIAE